MGVDRSPENGDRGSGRGSARPRVALVAGGGAVKAYAFHLGVLRAMDEDGFHFRSGLRWEPRCAPAGAREINVYVGSSAGACALVPMASGQGVEALYQGLRGTHPTAPTFGYRTLFVPVAPNPARYARRLARRWRLGGVRAQNLLDLSGVFSTAGVERYFRRHVLPTNRFADLAPDVYLTATQVNGARKVVFGPVDSITEGGGYDEDCAYYDNVPISQALAAAVAVPPVFAPYAIVNPSSGKRIHYYDGEVRQTLSAHVARDAGADFVIASSIWSPYRYDERMGSLGEMGMAVIAEQALHQIIGQKVEADRAEGRRMERLLQLVERRDRSLGLDARQTEAFKQELCHELGFRPLQSLYVLPDPSDYQFFLHGAFSFSRAVVDRCIEAGQRAYWRAVRQTPEFLPALDAALAG